MSTTDGNSSSSSSGLFGMSQDTTTWVVGGTVAAAALAMGYYLGSSSSSSNSSSSASKANKAKDSIKLSVKNKDTSPSLPPKKRLADAPEIYEEVLSTYNDDLAEAEEMIPIIGRLYRDYNVVSHMFGRTLVNVGAVEILKVHKFCQRYVKDENMEVRKTHTFLKAVEASEPGPCRVDVGQLLYGYYAGDEEAREAGVEEYVKQALLKIPKGPLVKQARDVVLFGFGRIGRLLARVLVEKQGGGDKLRLRAIVVRATMKDPADDLMKRASLLRRDSTHGQFDGSISVDVENQAIIANGVFIQVIFGDPSKINYREYGIDQALLVDNTGKFRDKKALQMHLDRPGVDKVLLTAPGKDIPNIVMGVNHMVPEVASSDILAMASCTTNAISPFLALLQSTYGVERCHVETIHSYTNDQNLLDNMHKKHRRGRGAATNMVITETGAAEAVTKVIPELKGKLSGNAIRVPTQDVSLAILCVDLEKETSTDEINEFFRQQSMFGVMRNQIDYSSSNELVSSDLVGNRYAGVLDSGSTRVTGTRALLYIWYDNEFGYTCQVVRMLQLLGKIVHPVVPKVSDADDQ